MANQGYASPGLEEAAIKKKSLALKVRLYGSTTEGSITAAILNCPDANARVWLSSQSATAPSDANFASLISSTSPTVIGLYLTVGDARYLHNVTVPTSSIRSASMTAGVATFKGATSDISGNTGVTSANNLAFQISCTAVDGDAAAINHEFDVIVDYSVV